METQATPALSSTEAEYQSMVSNAARLLMIRQVMEEVGLPKQTIRLGTDSSGARGVCLRHGVGKIRHLELKYLWLQKAVKDNRLLAEKVRGEHARLPLVVCPQAHHAAALGGQGRQATCR